MEEPKDSLASVTSMKIQERKKPELRDGTVYRACAYCRVSTDSDEQQTSFELQRDHFKKIAGEHGNWNLLHVYADEGISGTSTKHRVQFNEMIAACERGEYDLIVTKSVSRFARNIVDGISLARKLKGHNPPVGIFFETENIFTLSADSETMLSIMFALAQAESETKRDYMLWSLRERFKNGQLLTPELYGYTRERDASGRYLKDAKLIPVEDEARVVRFIYDAYLSGYTQEGIASVLNGLGLVTGTGSAWNSSGISYILSNERYCGNVITWKTFTYDLYEHRSHKNVEEEKYLVSDDHEAIISTEKFEAVQTLVENRKHGVKAFPMMHVVGSGRFCGFIPVNHHWLNEDINEYRNATDSIVDSRKTETVIPKKRFCAFNLDGYRIVSGHSMDSVSEYPMMTVSSKGLTFNTECVRNFYETGFVQFLLHPYERRFALRPCHKEDVHSIRWRSCRDLKIKPKSLTCPSLSSMLADLCGWNLEMRYRIRATILRKGKDEVMIFNVADARPYVVMATPPKREDGKGGYRTVKVENQNEGFGEDFYEKASRDIGWNGEAVDGSLFDTTVPAKTNPSGLLPDSDLSETIGGLAVRSEI